ncbi:MAG: 4Fe-4S binding protein, partial [Candidatus Bathyarchaeia archaeon]
MVNLRTMMESLKGLLKPATIRYPYQPSPPPEGFRGRPEFDYNKCMGCGGCVESCPSGALTLEDLNGSRSIRLQYGHCSFCGRCQDVCPEDAIKLTSTYELAVYRREEALLEVSLELGRCSKCGTRLIPSRQLDRIIDLVNKTLSEHGFGQGDFEVMLLLCPSCRWKPE